MLGKQGTGINLLLIGLAGSGLVGRFQAADQGGLPWWAWAVIVLVIIVLLSWWLLRQSRPEPLPPARSEPAVPRRPLEAPPQVEAVTPQPPVTAPMPMQVPPAAAPAVTEAPPLAEAPAPAVAQAPEAEVQPTPTAAAAEAPTAVPTQVTEPLATGAPAKPDDLTVIEGIGPKISRILQEAGITTFAQLAETDVERLRSILAAAGLRYLADPASWPEQARLAAAGDRAGLQALQASLKGGRRR